MREGDIYFDGATVRALVLGKASTGKVQLAITFDTGGEPEIVTAYRYFTDAAMPYTEADLRTIGWDPIANGWRVDDLLADQSPVVGNKVNLVCAEEDYEGKPRMRVKFINSIDGGGGMKDRLDPAEASAFATELRQRLGVTGGAKKATAKTTAKTPF